MANPFPTLSLIGKTLHDKGRHNIARSFKDLAFNRDDQKDHPSIWAAVVLGYCNCLMDFKMIDEPTYDEVYTEIVKFVQNNRS